MMTLNKFLLTVACIASSIRLCAQKPNLIVFQTDEHNFRTLGCYRNQLPKDQAFIWGEGVEVTTPNIDRLANEGAICNNFYASSPVCTPSRASLMSGLYPIATGSPSNNLPMKDEVVTFAKVLQQAGYATSYLGKWHLDGDAKPGFAPERNFGFEDNRFMFNRGHWKGLTDDDNGNPMLLGTFNPRTQNAKLNVSTTDTTTFTTDYLTNKALEILARDKDQPFCMMVSYPDPHTPNLVRPPYDTMFDHLYFEKPKSMQFPREKMPKWVSFNKEEVKEYEQKKMQQYFGMVKCIDDNIGRVLDFLDKEGLSENTLVVFTSDHGDLMGEHRRHNKGNPYEASAKIPFLIRYPKKIAPAKVINKAFTTVDFAPTILSLMGANAIPEAHGQDASQDFLSKEKTVTNDRIAYFTGSSGNWATAVTHRYKYVLSVDDAPWLFDLSKDPDELMNFYGDPLYAGIVGEMHQELLKQMKMYNDPGLHKKRKFNLGSH
ncbi:MAG: sulfatase [Cyclobacteriaceae bacterium]